MPAKARRGDRERQGLSDDVTYLLKGLRRRIQRSQFKQYQIEERAGFSSGYLSLLLKGAIELKYRHLLVIFKALEIEPSEFFGELFPHRGSAAHASLGEETVLDLVDRVARCEAAIDELTGLIKQDAGERT
jgi:transcriptional regulator with XRE-family HTH domain